MLIQEVSHRDALNLLAHLRLGRIACAEGAQPYVVPFYFVYHDGYLYSFSTVGQKIRWMRANPLVCVEVDEIVSSEEWVSSYLWPLSGADRHAGVEGGTRFGVQAAPTKKNLVGTRLRENDHRRD